MGKIPRFSRINNAKGLNKYIYCSDMNRMVHYRSFIKNRKQPNKFSNVDSFVRPFRHIASDNIIFSYEARKRHSIYFKVIRKFHCYYNSIRPFRKR